MIDELEAVRRVGAADDAPDGDLRQRVRARVLEQEGRRRAPAPRRLLGLALPAAVVAAGVALVVVLGGEAERPVEREQRPGRAAQAPPPSLFPAPGEFLYVRSRVQHLACQEDGSRRPRCALQPRHTREIWISERHPGRLVEPSLAHGTPVRLGRAQLYIGNRRFTHRELAGYSSTGAQLLRDLQEGRADGQGGSTATYPFVQLTDALREAPMPPGARRAIVEALRLVPGVRELGPATDAAGRRGVAYARTHEGRREEVVIDPDSLTMLEERTTITDDAAAPEGFSAGDRVGLATYLERAVVAQAGRRPGTPAEPGP